MTMRSNSNIMLLTQTTKDAENIYGEIDGFAMNYEELKELFWEAWRLRNIIIFILTDPKRKLKINFKVVMKTRTPFQKMLHKHTPF